MTRTRIRNTLSSAVRLGSYAGPDGGNYYSGGIGFNTQFGKYEICMDEVTPEWRTDRFKLMKITNNPFGLIREEHIMAPEFSGSWSVPSNRVTRTNGYYVDVAATLAAEFVNRGPTFDGDDRSRLAEIALVKAYANMNKSQINSAEIFSDLGSTIRMMQRPSTAIRRLTEAYRRNRRAHIAHAAQLGKSKRKAYNLPDKLTDLWLTYRMGIAPMVGDICTAQKLYTMREEMLAARFLVSRAGLSEETDGSVSFSLPGGYGFFPVIDGTVAWEHQVRANAGVLYQVQKQSSPELLASSAGLGLRIADLYETITLSFVVDWFIGIGDWLNAIQIPNNVTVNDTWVTTVDDFKKSISAVGAKAVNDWGTYVPISGDLGTHRYSKLRIERLTKQPLPLTPPVLRKPLAMVQRLDALSLIFRKCIMKTKT